MPQKIYFVRHGESLHGAQERYQAGDNPLSERGLMQARSVARRFTTITIDRIYTSPFPRVHKTAEFINKIVKKEMIILDLLRELKRPSEFTGKHVRDPEVLKIKASMREHAYDPRWHYSDEENFYELRDRVREVLRVLEQDPHKRILVVSHAVLMKVFALVMVMGDKATHDAYDAFYHHLRLTQTGITLFEKGTDGWLLMTWNDYAHLGEDTTEAAYK